MTELRTAPRQRRSQQSIDSILDAAERLIHEQGQVAFTANELAVAAKMSIGRVYYWFPDIPAVVAALAVRAGERLAAIYAEVIANAVRTDASMVIESSVGAMCTFIDQNPAAVALCLTSRHSVGPGVQLNDQMVATTAALIRAGVPGINEAEVTIVARTTVGIALGMLHGYASAGPARPFIRQELVYVLSAWLYCRFPPSHDRAWSDPGFPIRPSALPSMHNPLRRPVYPAVVAPAD